jgi:hypothetical protein
MQGRTLSEFVYVNIEGTRLQSMASDRFTDTRLGELDQVKLSRVIQNRCHLTFKWPCIVINSYNKTNQMHKLLKFIFGIKLYMFRTVPRSIVRSFSLYEYTQQWYMSYRFAIRIRTFRPDPDRKLSAKIYNIYHCCVYSEKLLMMDRGKSETCRILLQK